MGSNPTLSATFEDCIFCQKRCREVTASAKFKSVEEYVASQPPASREALRLVRKAIVKGLPLAEEVISYNMPAYKVGGKTVLQFAAWSGHYALYAATGQILRALKGELRGYETGKGTIRFPLDKPVPAKLIERIAKLRAAPIARD